MLKILHKGFQANLPLDPAALTGDVEADSASAYIQGLKGGRLVTVVKHGVNLCDGETEEIIGFLVNDAAGYFYENKPALASGLVAVSVGNQLVVTDQIDTTETFGAGDKLYAGKGAKAGLITKTQPAAGVAAYALALSSASAANPELQLVVF